MLLLTCRSEVLIEFGQDASFKVLVLVQKYRLQILKHHHDQMTITVQILGHSNEQESVGGGR